MEEQKKKNFFISYTGVDREWAKWIDWILRDAGYSTIIDCNDFASGQSFIRRMYEAIENAERTIAVITPDYFNAQYTGPEWEAAFANDPSGQKRLLIPIRVKPFTPPKFFTTRIYIDLAGEHEEQVAKDKLLRGVDFEEPSHLTRQPYPLAKPSFPNKINQLPFSNKVASVGKPKYLAMSKLGQLDRKVQAAYLHSIIPKDIYLRKGQMVGFIVCGPRNEWPESISHRLNYLITSRTLATGIFPELILTNKELVFDLNNSEEFLWEFLGQSLVITGRNMKKEIKLRLEMAEQCYIFSRKVLSDEARKPELLVGMLSAWQKIKLKKNSPCHFLLLICESEQLRTQIDTLLKQNNNEQALLPPLKTPAWADVVNDWVEGHFDSDNHGALIDAIWRKTDEIRNKFPDQESIPLMHLREHFKVIFQNHSI